MQQILVEEGKVGTVTINRPDRRNALTVENTRELSEALVQVATTARVVILTGAGSAFCAGGDFSELQRLAEAGEAEAGEQLYSGYQQMIRTVRALDVPVIAAVNGPAAGAGLDLALCCDLRVASTTATFGQVWAKVGLIPGTAGAYWTTLLAGPARAAQMLLTAEAIDARTAAEWGLVNEVVPPDRLLERTSELAETIAALPPGAVAANKRALDDVLKPHYERALDYAKVEQAKRFASEEFRQALYSRGSKT